jgi:hypothetical protein
MAKAPQSELDQLQAKLDAATKANDTTAIAAAKKALADAKARS